MPGKMIGEYSEEHLLKTAREAVLKKTKNSTMLDKEAEDRIPKFGEEGKRGVIKRAFALAFRNPISYP